MVSMSVLLALQIVVCLVMGLEDALPGRVSHFRQEYAPKCHLSKMEESMSRFSV